MTHRDAIPQPDFGLGDKIRAPCRAEEQYDFMLRRGCETRSANLLTGRLPGESGARRFRLGAAVGRRLAPSLGVLLTKSVDVRPLFGRRSADVRPIFG